MGVMPNKVAVVIPNWNGRKMIGPCIESLLSQSLSCDVVVVDNGSHDESVEFIEKNFSQVHLIKNPKNLGFAGGMNAGINYCLSKHYQYIGSLNNDAVVDKDWLKYLLDSIKKNETCGSATGLILTTDKTHIDNTGDFYNVWGQTVARQRGVIAKDAAPDSEFVFGAAAGSCLYSAKMLRQVGGFDEMFFAYLEDTDLNFRAQLLGWKSIYDPRAITYHAINATSSKLGDFTSYHTLKNYFYLYFKNMPGLLFWKYLPKFSLGFLYISAAKLYKLKFLVILKAYFMIFINFPRLVIRRYKIQRSRKVSVEYIDSILLKKFPFRLGRQ